MTQEERSAQAESGTGTGNKFVNHQKPARWQNEPAQRWLVFWNPVKVRWTAAAGPAWSQP